MKKVFFASAIIISLSSCGGANDGNPNTDTTSTIPPDTSEMNSNAGDTATTINTNTGSFSRDTANK